MRVLKFFVAVLLILSFGHVNAEEKKTSIDELKSSIESDIKKDIFTDIKKSLGLTLYFQGGYIYNFENPQSQINDLRVFDSKANSMMLDLAQITFAKDAEKDIMGYKIKISAGETAKFIHSAGLGTPTESFDLTEAYIDYILNAGKGIKFRFGKYATFIGAEVIEAIDNPNYSRSLLFNYAIPFTHTGLMVEYPFTDKISASLHIVNGWDNTEDNNNGKTAGLSLSFTPNDTVKVLTNVMYGPEQTSNNSNNRFLLDIVSTIAVAKNLSLILNVDYGTEEGQGLNGTDADWKGIAGIIKYDYSDKYGLAVRGEYFKDTDGVRTGTAQEVKELTITPEIKLSSGLIIRPEYRHDWSTSNFFNGSTKKSQDTIALGVMYKF